MFKITSVAAAVLLSSTTALAQDQKADELEEIVVTAAKRAQTLQEIPIAVSVTSAETIEQAQIQDVLDLQSVVPSLRVTQLQTSRNTNFVIRGFGNGANNPGIEPSVGIFIDGVYRSRSAAGISDLPRLERVEVLRGPQSTLFGKNASAGVINVVTPKPSGEQGGYISGSVGNYGAVVLKGLYEGAISETASYDLAASMNQRDGYFQNLGGGEDYNQRDRFSVRGQLLLNPSDTTEIRVIADYDKIDEVCCGVANLVSGPATGAIRAVGGNLVENDPFARANFLNFDPRNEVENSGISAQVDIEFERFTLTSISSSRNSDILDTPDIDFTGADLVGQAINDIDIDTVTQEIRFTSNGGETFDWMVGGFYFNEDVDYTADVLFGTAFRPYADALVSGVAPGVLGFIESILGLPVGQTFFAPGSGVVETQTIKNEAISVFGQFDWNISDSLTASVGFNYTDDEKEVAISQVNTDVFSSLPLDSLGLGALSGLQFLPPFLEFPNAIEDGRTKDDELTYSLRLSYDVNESVSTYVSYSTGFKASSWNLSRDSRPFARDIPALLNAGLGVTNLVSGSRFAEPENAEVFELGLKAKFDRASLNVAVFDQSIEGFQGNIFTGTGFILSNAGKQSTRGIEFDLAYFATNALKFNVAGTFLDPEYDSFVGGSGPNGPEDLSGQAPAGVNEVSLSLGATYSFTLASLDGYLRADYQYDDEVQVVDNISADIATREVKQLNASFGLRTENGLSFSVWGRNLTDNDYLLSAFPSLAQAGSFSSYPNEPRTYGVTIKKDF